MNSLMSVSDVVDKVTAHFNTSEAGWLIIALTASCLFFLIYRKKSVIGTVLSSIVVIGLYIQDDLRNDFYGQSADAHKALDLGTTAAVAARPVFPEALMVVSALIVIATIALATMTLFTAKGFNLKWVNSGVIFGGASAVLSSIYLLLLDLMEKMDVPDGHFLNNVSQYTSAFTLVTLVVSGLNFVLAAKTKSKSQVRKEYGVSAV